MVLVKNTNPQLVSTQAVDMISKIVSHVPTHTQTHATTKRLTSFRSCNMIDILCDAHAHVPAICTQLEGTSA